MTMKYQSWVKSDTAIHDSSTNRCIVDSIEIARYLDAQYPDTPKVLDGLVVDGGSLGNVVELLRVSTMEAITKVFGLMTAKSVVRHLSFFTPTFAFKDDTVLIIMAMTQAIINPGSAGYFRQTREAMFGTALENLLPAAGAKDPATWVAFVSGLDKLAAVYTTSGPWLLGDRFSFADATTVGFLVWIKRTCGQNSEEWKAIEESGKGHWKRQIDWAEREWLVGGN